MNEIKTRFGQASRSTRHNERSSIQSQRGGSSNNKRRARAWIKRIVACIVGLLVVQYMLAGSTLSDGKDDDSKAWLPKRVLIVSAHPDDEAMFFAPAILSLVERGIDVHALCMSSGNADKIGHVRAHELIRSYGILGVHQEDVQLIDDENAFPDGMHVQWNVNSVVEAIRKQDREKGPYDVILTFDHAGITQHPNHISCWQAVERFVSSSSLTFAYSLQSLPIANKFFSLPGAIVRHILARTSDVNEQSNGDLHEVLQATPPSTIAFLSTPMQYLQALRAMAQHRSQLVWFRFLYVIFSGYMYGVQVHRIV